MRVLVTGAGGQLGRDLCRVFSDLDLVAMTRADLDISNETDVAEVVDQIAPDVVVNAAAWTDVDGCEADEDRAHLHNALGPWWLARACSRQGAKLVHISSDYVFSGQVIERSDGTLRPWNEFDPVEPVNAYGRSKAAGEQLIRQTLPEHHIVRTAWVNGAHGSNFVRTMLRLGRERGELEVVDDQVGSPTFTADLALAIRELTGSDRYGTVNRTNHGYCSWYQLAAATFEFANLEVDLRPTTSNRFVRPAARPAWSVLDDCHARLVGLTGLPPWQDGLRRLLSEWEEGGAS
jgi:dTDP-4-dehydrorhamnose reductase